MFVSSVIWGCELLMRKTADGGADIIQPRIKENSSIFTEHAPTPSLSDVGKREFQTVTNTHKTYYTVVQFINIKNLEIWLTLNPHC